jgi:hypothetical protein
LAAAGLELRLDVPRPLPDPQRADAVLQDVLGLAELLPYRSRGLRFPPFRQRVA